MPTSLRNGLNMISIQITPNTLNSVCARAARFAEVFPTAAAIFAVMVVPMFSPRTIAQASSKSISPEVVRSMVMAMVALDACRTIVRMVPARRNMMSDQNPNSVKCAKNATIASLLLSNVPAELFMNDRPRNIRAKPTMNSPTCLYCCFFELVRMNPKIINGTENAEMSTENLTAVTHAVSVVPIFAPMMMPTACTSVSSPAFTKLTTSTVVALDDCTSAVIPRPVRTRLRGLDVIEVRIPLSLSPEAF